MRIVAAWRGAATKLATIPGVHLHHVGYGEARAWIASDDRAALEAVARLVRVRRRRRPTVASMGALERARASRASEIPWKARPGEGAHPHAAVAELV